MFFKPRHKKTIATLSLLVLGLTGVFSFCFAHEAAAHPEHESAEHISAVSELHDNHCGSEVTVDKLAPNKDSIVQLIQNYFPVIAFLGDTITDGGSGSALSSFALPRGRPPSLQPAHLQVFRC